MPNGPTTFFTIDTGPDGAEWFVPTDHSRGPWDVDACHAGPPTSMLARALERALPALRLTRLTVDLVRPVPMAGFRIETVVERAGRTMATTRASIVDGAGVVRATATGMHIAIAPRPVVAAPLDNSDGVTPRLADATPGAFPIRKLGHDRPGFNSAVAVRYPPGHGPDPGATTVWMRTVPLLPDEEPSPFQRIGPLADCGNAFSRHAEPEQMRFLNTDLTIVLHRDPEGEWLGSRVTGQWQPSGIGLADALLFDDRGPVGRALQALVLRPAE